MKNPHVSALAAAHGVAVLFGLTGILGALIRFDAVAITAGRAGFAATALLVLALAQRRPLLQGLGPRRAGIVLASGFLLAVHWITFFMAVKVGGVAVATLGFASFPAFIALLDVVLFRERIGRAEGTMLALVTLGLVLVTPSFDVGDQGTVGLLWGLASGLSFAGLAICNRQSGHGCHPGGFLAEPRRCAAGVAPAGPRSGPSSDRSLAGAFLLGDRGCRHRLGQLVLAGRAGRPVHGPGAHPVRQKP